jgi:hypothetical protein
MKLLIRKMPYLDVNQSAIAFGERSVFTETGATNPAILLDRHQTHHRTPHLGQESPHHPGEHGD